MRDHVWLLSQTTQQITKHTHTHTTQCKGRKAIHEKIIVSILVVQLCH